MLNSQSAHDAQEDSASEPQENVDNVIEGPWVNDAKVFGELDDEMLDRQIELGLSPHGSKTMPGRWRKWNTSVRDFLTRLSTHDLGEKDGNAFLQGPAIDGERKAMAIPHLDLLVLDLDTGEKIDEMREKLQALGLFAILYTTHSHLKPVSDIKKDAVVKWLNCGDVNPDIEQVKAYLISEKRYQEWVLEGASILKTEHTAEGVMIFVAHKPMPKFRVVLLLKERFVIADRQGTQADAIAEWKQRYAGASKLLGAFFDRSCVDPSRLFYLPRHPKGAKEYRIEVIAGKPLDLEEVDRVSVKETSGGAYEQALGSENGGQDYKTDGMLRFAKKYAHLFDFETFLLEVDPDGDRGSRPSGPGRTHRCPNDNAHSNAGDDSDAGFFCINGTEAETGGFVGKCMHDSCVKEDRLFHLDLACVAAGITSADELKKWVPEVVDDEDGEEELPKPVEKFGNIAEANRVAKAVTDTAGAYECARRLGVSNFSAGQVTDIIKQIASQSGADQPTLRKEMKAAVKAKAVDDDTMEKLNWVNETYAIVSLGSQIKIMEKQEAGVAPVFRSRDDFNFLMAKHRVKQQDAAGNVKLVSVAVPWSQWEDRREFKKVVFEPDGCRPDWCNTWNGFPIKGVEGSWSVLRGHVFDNICLGNLDYFNWLMTWLADILQHPGDKKGSCVVIRGKKGSGKSILFDFVRDALQELALKVSQRDHIVGQFNAHQQGKLLLVCEEALWAGDKAVEGVLKDLITSKEMLMTPKGIDSIKVRNHMRLALISNEGWVVPAGLEDERRFFVLQCGNAVRENTAFFDGLVHQMRDKGGLQAMVHELINWKPTMFDEGWSVLRKPPVTPWLTEQAQESMHVWDRFFYQVVDAGAFEKPVVGGDPEMVPLNEDDETMVSKTDLQAAYVIFLGKTNTGRQKIGDMKLFKEMVEDWLCASPIEVRMPALGVGKDKCFQVPSLKAIKANLGERKHLSFSAFIDQKDLPVLKKGV